MAKDFYTQRNITHDDANVGPINWPGGPGVFTCDGTWDGSTQDLQFSNDGGTTKTALGTDTTLTADGGGSFVAPPGELYIVGSGGSGSVDLNAIVSALNYAVG